MEIAFWILAGVIAYVYAGYPVLLWLLQSLGFGKAVAWREPEPGGEPKVTLLISAYNEVEVIADKIRNSLALDYPGLALDYPAERLEIVVISDASDDGTDQAVAAFGLPNVKLLRMEGRGGKTVGLNAALKIASGDIVVFSDANAMYEPRSLRNMVRNFADPAVGAVVGESTYSDAAGNAQENEGLYWKYELAIKRLETRLGSVVGGDGAIYAIRKQLYRDMRPDALSDFVNPMQVVQSGHRCIYEPQARSVEEAADNLQKEFRRKIRIVNRAWRALWTMPAMMNPFKYGFFAVEVVSHKLLRWLIPVFLVAFFTVSALAAGNGWIYAAALWAQTVLYLCALVGYFMRHSNSMPAFLAVPYYFCLVNYASARGIVEAYRGKTYTTWNTPRTT
jgi:cellulose synthase/poly-beta-1,6-N-acetylglucosamine synthase-like glycosyltransferase